MALSDQIIGVESGGNPNPPPNPNSSASGPAQFINGTWLATIRAHRPDLAGQTDDQLLALKSDPQLSREMTDAYASDNQAILTKNGLPVTPGNTYLAHFAGPQGAVKILQADPSASAESVLGAAAVKANPFLRNMTAQDVQAWASRKMGGQTPQPGAPATQGAPQPAQPPPATIPQPQAPIFAGTPSVAPAAPQPFADPSIQAPPIFMPQQRQIDLSGLRAALAKAPIFANRG